MRKSDGNSRKSIFQRTDLNVMQSPREIVCVSMSYRKINKVWPQKTEWDFENLITSTPSCVSQLIKQFAANFPNGERLKANRDEKLTGKVWNFWERPRKERKLPVARQKRRFIGKCLIKKLVDSGKGVSFNSLKKLSCQIIECVWRLSNSSWKYSNV